MNPTPDPSTVFDAMISRAADQVSAARQRCGSRRAAGGVGFPGYEIIGERQRGGQGSLIEAVQKSTGRRVAIKELHGTVWNQAAQRLRFAREVQILAQLRHPNIVTIHDSSMDAASLYYIMDYVQGEALDVWIARRGPEWTPRDTLRLIGQVCAGVQAAHVRGVIHRDLKPANILVDTAGEPRLVDFGLAKPIAEDLPTLTHDGQFVGSLPWSSPEQVAGSPDRVDSRSDVYAMGVMLYHALTGAFPYAVNGSMADVVRQITTTVPARPSALCPALDGEIDTIVLTCLHKDSERRYQTAGDLGRDIEHYLSGRPLEARRDSAVYVLRKTVRRYRVPLAALTLFMAVLAASSVVSWRLYLKARAATTAARAATDVSRRHLNESLVAQASATRRTGHVGQRFDALAALTHAARIEPTLAARNEAIAALATPDLRLLHQLGHIGTAYFDRTLATCAVVDAAGAIRLVRMADDVVLGRIGPPAAGLGELHWIAVTDQFVLRLFDPPSGDRHLEVWAVPADHLHDGGPQPPPAAGAPSLEGQVPEMRLHWQLTDVPLRARFDLMDGDRVVVVGRRDQALHFIDIASGQDIRSLALDVDASYVRVDPSGRYAVLFHGNYTAARILDIDTGHPVPAFGSTPIAWSVDWHPDGQWVAGAAGVNIELWDAQHQRSVGRLTGHQSQVVVVRYSSDGRYLVSFSWDGVARLWDARTQRPILQLPMAFPVFSEEGLRIGGTAAIDGYPRAVLHELNTAPECRFLVGADDPATFVESTVAFDPAGRLWVGQTSQVPEARGLRIFDVDRVRQVAAFDGGNAWSVAWDSAAQAMVVGQDDGVRRWSFEAGALQPLDWILSGRAMTGDVSAAGDLAVIGGALELVFMDLTSLTVQHRVADASPEQINQARVTPDGRWAAIDGWKAAPAEVWDVARRRRVAEIPSCQLGRLAFSPDNLALATCGHDGLSLRHAPMFQVVHRAPGVYGPMRFSPDARLLAAVVGSGTVVLFDARTLEEVASLDPPPGDATTALAFNADGTRLAQATNHAGIVILWDLRAIRARLSDMDLDWTDRAPPETDPHHGTTPVD